MEVNPEILSSSCTRLALSASTSCFLWFNSSSLRFKPLSRFSTASNFLSRVSSLERTRRSYFCTSLRRSLISLSSSFLALIDSSFASRRIPFFFVSAVLSASSIISLALASALPIFLSVTFLWYVVLISHVTGAATTNVTTQAIIIYTCTGAPPYLVFIVILNYNKDNFILF